MLHATKVDKSCLQIFILVMACTIIYAITNLLGQTITGRTYYLLTPLIFIWMLNRHYPIPQLYKLYSITLLVIVTLHIAAGTEIESTIHFTAFVRITPILLLAAFRYQSKPLKLVMILGFIFYFLECSISIYERLTFTHLINYENSENTQATNALVLDNTDFRSFSLMFHPLFNANTISIFIAFILCNKNLGPIAKYLLLILGLAAIWGTNSRGCMIIWAIILIYRFCFYNIKVIYMIFSITLLYIILPIIAEWLLASGLLGRFGDFDFSDSSTLTRLEAFDVFFNYKWTTQDLLIGGRLLTYPDMLLEVGLENGFLLDLGYWGIIGGLIKSIGEILITYFALNKYQFKDRIIFMLAIWGVAFMNNNSYGIFIMPMFVIAYITFFSFDIYQTNNKIYRKHPKLAY